jgi:hypothetical protein
VRVCGLQSFIWALILALSAQCAHTPPGEESPWDLIKNHEARERYMMVQAVAGHLPYEHLYHNIQLLHEMYPDEDVISITHAGVYGDYGQTKTAQQEQRHKSKAVEWLQPFVKKVYKSPIAQDRILAFNQYYYHSGQYLKQYEYGKKIIELGGRGGEVLVGVGGAMQAQKLDQQKNLLKARVMALEARQAWEQLYDLSIPQMQDAAYKNNFYLTSLALTGECGQAQEVFDSLIKNSRRYSEMPRWYEQFNPQKLNNCQSQRQLTSDPSQRERSP